MDGNRHSEHTELIRDVLTTWPERTAEQLADAHEALDSLFEQLQAAERKVEAYDRARSDVKITGNTRAEYVLRIEALEEQLEAVREALLAFAYAQDYDANGNEYFVHGKRTREMAEAVLASVSDPATRPDYPCDCGPDEYCSSDQCHGAVPDPSSGPRISDHCSAHGYYAAGFVCPVCSDSDPASEPKS